MAEKIVLDASKLLGNNSKGDRMTGTGKPKLVKLTTPSTRKS
ncbi:hypothetical protein [Oricola sp.]|nr:hypothetical protein [Oricola sp.]